MWSIEPVSIVGRTASASPTRSSRPLGSNVRGAARIGRAEVGQHRTGAVALAGRSRTTEAKIAAQRGSSSIPSARRGPRAMAAPSSVPPTPANGSRTSSPVWLKNSISRAIRRGGLLAPCARRAAWPSSDG